MSAQEDAFYSEATALQQALFEMNALRENIRNYTESANQFNNLVEAEKAKLDALIAEVRPKVVTLMSKFEALSQPTE